MPPQPLQQLAIAFLSTDLNSTRGCLLESFDPQLPFSCTPLVERWSATIAGDVLRFHRLAAQSTGAHSCSIEQAHSVENAWMLLQCGHGKQKHHHENQDEDEGCERGPRDDQESRTGQVHQEVSAGPGDRPMPNQEDQSMAYKYIPITALYLFPTYGSVEAAKQAGVQLNPYIPGAPLKGWDDPNPVYDANGFAHYPFAWDPVSKTVIQDFQVPRWEFAYNITDSPTYQQQMANGTITIVPIQTMPIPLQSLPPGWKLSLNLDPAGNQSMFAIPEIDEPIPDPPSAPTIAPIQASLQDVYALLQTIHKDLQAGFGNWNIPTP